MSRGEKERQRMAAERALWRHSQAADAPADEAGWFLDLAAFAGDRLDADERERVAALLAGDPAAAADVAAARASGDGAAEPAERIERIVARAAGLVPAPAERGRLLHFTRPTWRRAVLPGLAQWASLAAAVALVGWLGFAMGSDASRALSQPSQIGAAGERGIVPDLLDPTSSVGDLGEGLLT